MRIAVATVQVPFIRGGAEALADGLVSALRAAGHETEMVTMPFRFDPMSEVRRSMEVWSNEKLDRINGYEVHWLIALKFPAFYPQHPNKVAWLLHQHRSVYDLWNTKYGAVLRTTPGASELKQAITEQDTAALRGCRKVFTIAKEVSKRLQDFNGVPSRALYHPPPLAPRIFSEAPEPYVFFPSRLEELKRQALLIDAMRYTRSPLIALIAGDGGFRDRLEKQIAQYDLQQRVRLLGRISEDEMLAYYAHALAVWFGPFEEDYGYVTLEAMLAHKPVVTCSDAGGPLEFVVNGETGLVTPPEPQAIAEALDRLYADRQRAIAMGHAGAERYAALDISWGRVVDELLA
jgi:glycosyltransferase involved in cell wall biosynthesis